MRKITWCSDKKVKSEEWRVNNKAEAKAKAKEI